MPKFRIKGIDTELSLWANDENNVKVKADLEGVAVTSVTLTDSTHP